MLIKYFFCKCSVNHVNLLNIKYINSSHHLKQGKKNAKEGVLRESTDPMRVPANSVIVLMAIKTLINIFMTTPRY